MLTEILLITLWKLLMILILLIFILSFKKKKIVRKKVEVKPEIKDEFFAFRKLFSEKTTGGIGK